LRSIKSEADFKNIRKFGKKLHFKYGIIYKGDGALGLELGIIASKKLGNAVNRNRIKRRVTEAFRNISKNIDIKGKIIVIPSPATAKVGFAELRNSLGEIFNRS